MIKTIICALFITFSLIATGLAQDITGENLTEVQFTNGSYVFVGGIRWIEKRRDGSVAHTYEEVGRINSRVVLNGISNEYFVALDLNAYEIDVQTVSGQQINNYDIQGTSGGHTLDRSINNSGQAFDAVFNKSSAVSRPDLSNPWNSDFGAINWQEGFYSNQNKTLNGQLVFEGNRYFYIGRWGRNDSNQSGGVRFIFSRDGLSFTGTYINSNGREKPWNGQR